MRRYRLIKEYPNSPPINTIVHKDSNTWIYYKGDTKSFWGIHKTEPKDYPEYWEEVIERDYQILSFSCNNSSSILLELHEDGKYSYKKAKNYSGIGRLTEQECLKDSYYQIHSIKRLSDGEVFTVGNKVNSELFDKSPQIISNITNRGKIQIWIDNGRRFWYLENVTKFKQPLFTTEDGVDIHYDKIFFNVNNFEVQSFQVTNDKYPLDFLNDGSKQFSTIEAAEEYVFMNKPCLSINDIINSTNFKFQTVIDELKTKVKIKLK